MCLFVDSFCIPHAFWIRDVSSSHCFLTLWRMPPYRLENTDNFHQVAHFSIMIIPSYLWKEVHKKCLRMLKVHKKWFSHSFLLRFQGLLWTPPALNLASPDALQPGCEPLWLVRSCRSIRCSAWLLCWSLFGTLMISCDQKLALLLLTCCLKF